MLLLKWTARMVRDVVKMGVFNRRPGLTITVLILLILGAVVGAAQVSAPFIYTLF